MCLMPLRLYLVCCIWFAVDILCFACCVFYSYVGWGLASLFLFCCLFVVL